jgi:hypothetical protein
MAFEQERERIAQIVDKHGHVPMTPEYSAPVARHIVKYCQNLRIKPPLVIQRFMDRLDGPKGQDGALDKLGRDLHGREYSELTEPQRQQITSIHSSLGNANPATGHPYLKPGFDFAQGHDLLVSAYGLSMDRFQREIRASMQDFISGLEKDLDQAAKAGGFFKQYSDATTALRIATAGPHRINQSIPIVAKGAR